MSATLDPVSGSAFCGLLELTGLAEQAYSRASDKVSALGSKALVRYLSIQHAEHVEDLRKHANEHLIFRTSTPALDPAFGTAWSGMCEAMESEKCAVVVATCQLTERFVLRAYGQAQKKFACYKSTFALVSRHIRELNATRGFVCMLGSDDVVWQGYDSGRRQIAFQFSTPRINPRGTLRGFDRAPAPASISGAPTAFLTIPRQSAEG